MYATLFWNTLTLTGVSIAIFFAVLVLGIFTKVIFLKIANVSIDQSKFNTGFLAALPFGLAAIVLGMLSGSSNEPSIAAMITGLISLISGAAFIVFHKDIQILMPVGIAVMIFALNLFAGTSLGQGARESEKAIAKALSKKESTEEERVNLYLKQSRVEFRVNNYRNNLGLPSIKLISDANGEKNPNKSN